MNFENARLFLYRVLPWAPVGDPTAFVNIHWTFQGAGYNKPAWGGRACISIDECIRSVQWATKLPDTRDVYVCMSTQRECEEVVSQGGRLMRKAYREGKNAVQVRALWLDIDINDGHHKSAKNNPESVYQTQAEAGAAFAKFLKDSGIPRPTMIVSTGSGGIHCYWTLNQAIDIPTWQPLANALAEATRRFGLKNDTQCIVDGVRVMRLPDTKHSKHGTKAELFAKTMLPYDYSLDQMRHALAPYMGAQVIPLNPRGNDVPNLNAALAGGISTPQAAPINLRTVADAGCGFIRHALDHGGRAYGQPLWNLTTLISTFSDGGRADAHIMSAGHSTYSAPETDELYDRKVREREEKNLGWPSCQSVENAGCAACNNCPLKGPGTRPLQFGRPASVPTAPVTAALAQNEPDLPHGYSRSIANIISKVVIAGDGTTRLATVSPYPIWEGWLQDEPWTLHFKTKIGDVVRRLKVEGGQINTQDGFGKALGLQGVYFTIEQGKFFREFIVAWATKLQQTKDAVVSSAPFGWSAPQGKVNGFVYGGRVWQQTTDKPAAAPDPVMAGQYNPRGKIEPWLKAAKMVTDLNSPGHNCILACAFAGPLVRFTGLQGLLVSAYSTESGIYKTGAMRTAQAVWGSPQTAMQGLTDTSNQVLNKIGALKALPLFWDELKTEQDTTKFVNMAFQLSSGKEKGRLNSDASQRTPGTWQTLLVSASNDSILDNVMRATKSTTAGIYRVFEYVVERQQPTLSASAADQVLLKLHDNYGAAGLAYAQFLGREYDRVHAEVAACREKLERATNAKPDERFWIGCMTVILMGAKYSNELNLTQIDLPGLAKHLLKTLSLMRSELSDSPSDISKAISVGNILNQYLNQMRNRHTLITSRLHVGQGKPSSGSVVIQSDPTKLDALYVHVGRDNKLMRIQSAHFRHWLSETGYSPHNIVRAMELQIGMRKMNGRLGSGTIFAGLTEYLFELDLGHPELKKLSEL